MRAGDVVLEWSTPAGSEAGRVLTATLDRPGRRNAISATVTFGLEAAVHHAGEEGAAVLVIRGAGGTFCAGADLDEVLAVLDDRDGLAAFVTPLAEVCSALEAAPFATMAVVDGFALAGGCELLLACDVVLTANEALIGDRHLELGLLPGAGGSVRLHRALSPARSRWLLLSGEMITGAQAAAWGLVTRSVAGDRLEAEAADMVIRLATRSPSALAAAKRMVAAVRDVAVDDGVVAERDIFLDTLSGDPAVAASLRSFFAREVAPR